MPVRSFSTTRWRCPTRRTGKRYYQDFGLVDATGATRRAPSRRLARSAQPCSCTAGRASGCTISRSAPPGEEFAAVRAACAAAGIAEIDPPRGAPEGGIWMRDPDGNLVNVREDAAAACPPDPPLQLNGPGYTPRQAHARLPASAASGDAPAAGPRAPVHPRRRPADRLLHARARAQAVRPLRNVIAFLRCNTDHHNLALLASSGRGSITPRSRSGASTRSRWAPSRMARPRLAAGLGARPPRHRLELLLLHPRSVGRLRRVLLRPRLHPRGLRLGSPRDFALEDALYVWGPPRPRGLRGEQGSRLTAPAPRLTGHD